MYLAAETNRVYNALKDCAALDGCRIIKAYPYAKKPTKLRRTVITVSPSDAEFKNTALGFECAYGKYAVAVDIFIPLESGSPAESGVCDGVINGVLALKPDGIRLTEFRPYDELGAYGARCIVSFSGSVNSPEN